MRRSIGLPDQAASVNRRSRLDGVIGGGAGGDRLNSPTSPASRRPLRRGCRTSPAANLAVETVGTNRRSGLRVAWTSSASSGAA